MVNVKVRAIRDNTFVPKGIEFIPRDVETKAVELDDATGLKFTFKKDDEEPKDKYYYIGDEITKEQFDSLINNGYKISEEEKANMREYTSTFGINRYGVIKDGDDIKAVKPLMEDENMLASQDVLFSVFNTALELSTQKVLTYQRKIKKNDKKS